MEAPEKNGWQARFGWIWYNEDEIFHYTQEDMDRKVKAFADEGLTILIGFSCTHFRFSFVRQWGLINDCIEKLARACHKYGILYVEHHSSHLTYHPEGEDEYRAMERLFGTRHTTRQAWDGFDDGAFSDDVLLDGKKVSSFRQVSGATGKWGRTCYQGYAMCFNNPDYQKAYFRYLEDVYARGVDGIMTDDLQFFGNDDRGRWNACTCEHCRRLFREKTGYEIPGPEDWDSFYNNFDDPVFIAWKRFKDESTKNFVYMVNRHYESLGYKMLRPNYISSVIAHNLTAYPFECCSEVWDYIFQENCSNLVIRESYLMFATEAVHRFAMARGRGVPSMSMFYPSEQSSLAFSWALSKAWGQLYTQTPAADNLGNLSEQRCRDFEKAHADLFEKPHKIADVAFLLSANTRDYTAKSFDYMNRFLCWMQASYLSVLGTDMVFEDEPQQDYDAFRCVMAADAAMLSAACLDKLAEYARRGGTLVIAGPFGIFDTDGSDGSGRIPAVFGALPAQGESVPFGKGRIWVLADDACSDRLQNSVGVRFDESERQSAPVPPYEVDNLRRTGGTALRAVLGRGSVEARCAADLFCSAFENPSGIAVHLVNVENTVSRSGMTDKITPIPSFAEGAAPIGPAEVSLRTDMEPRKLLFFTPEHGGETALSFRREGDRLLFTVPGGLFSGYGAVQILK